MEIADEDISGKNFNQRFSALISRQNAVSSKNRERHEHVEANAASYTLLVQEHGKNLLISLA